MINSDLSQFIMIYHDLSWFIMIIIMINFPKGIVACFMHAVSDVGQ